jgi:hypothetical protein
MKNTDPAARIFKDDGAPATPERANALMIRSHDADEHKLDMATRKRLHLHRLRAAQREIETLVNVLKNADKSGRDLPHACLFASAALHEVEKRAREIAGVIARHEREFVALETQ